MKLRWGCKKTFLNNGASDVCHINYSIKWEMNKELPKTQTGACHLVSHQMLNPYYMNERWVHKWMQLPIWKQTIVRVHTCVCSSIIYIYIFFFLIFEIKSLCTPRLTWGISLIKPSNSCLIAFNFSQNSKSIQFLSLWICNVIRIQLHKMLT